MACGEGYFSTRMRRFKRTSPAFCFCQCQKQLAHGRPPSELEPGQITLTSRQESSHTTRRRTTTSMRQSALYIINYRVHHTMNHQFAGKIEFTSPPITITPPTSTYPIILPPTDPVMNIPANKYVWPTVPRTTFPNATDPPKKPSSVRGWLCATPHPLLAPYARPKAYTSRTADLSAMPSALTSA